MEILIELRCPQCNSGHIKKNGLKIYGIQNYQCLCCGRQFIGDRALKNKGSHSGIVQKIKKMLVRGVGIRDIVEIESVSIQKVLSVLVNSSVTIKPHENHYDSLEIDELWTYIGDKGNKKWFIYAYHRDSGEIVAWVWGSRSRKTVRKLKKKLETLSITYDYIYSDDWNSFKKVFAQEKHIVGKANTVGIEGNNCRLRHRVRRAYRKTCCFSKKLINHVKAFELAIFFINYGWI